MNNKTSFEILDNADVPSRHAAAGEVILAAGSDSKEMFIIRKGTVAISVGGKVVEAVGHGGIFGEMGLIDFETRSADAIAVEDCDLVPIDGAAARTDQRHRHVDGAGPGRGVVLAFERPLNDLQTKIDELRRLSSGSHLELAGEIQLLEERLASSK